MPDSLPTPDAQNQPLTLFQRWWFWALIALVVLVIAFVAIINSAGAPAPDPEPADDSVVDQPVALTVAPIETTCSAVTHSPPPGTATSPSWVLVALMIIAITQAPIDVGTPVSITVDGSDTTPIETEVGSNGTVTATVPISSYGTYEVTEIAVGSDGEQVSAPGPLPVIEVTAQEQPVTCSGPGAAVLEEAAQQHEP